jgi:hypothetical protein
MAHRIALSRHLIGLALAALVVPACNVDEPATFVPKAGTWSYEEQSVVSNSCGDQLGMPSMMSTFLLDYDGGDEFQIELGTEDILCEIDGADFSCASYLAGTAEVPGLMATLDFRVMYSGEFASDEVADGNAVTTVTCTGEDWVSLTTLPCTRNVTFAVEFVM